MTPQQAAEVMRIVCDLIVGAVKEAGDLGVPGGLLFAAMRTQRISLAQFEQLMAALVRTGKLRKRGELYFWVEDL
jgi:hypothetical protein